MALIGGTRLFVSWVVFFALILWMLLFRLFFEFNVWFGVALAAVPLAVIEFFNYIDKKFGEDGDYEP